MPGKALVIDYLYNDLPAGHTVLADEWNDAMTKIKSAINSHAKQIDKTTNIPYLVSVGTSENPWLGDQTNGYYFNIPNSSHNKGLHPRITICGTDGIVYNDSPTIDLKTGDITIHSNKNPKILNIVVE